MGIPQIIVICLYAIGVGLSIGKHGEPKEGNYSFWISIIGAGIMISILWWGGFFE